MQIVSQSNSDTYAKSIPNDTPKNNFFVRLPLSSPLDNWQLATNNYQLSTINHPTTHWFRSQAHPSLESWTSLGADSVLAPPLPAT